MSEQGGKAPLSDASPPDASPPDAPPSPAPTSPLWLLLKGCRPVLATEARGVDAGDIIGHGWEGVHEVFVSGLPPGWEGSAIGASRVGRKVRTRHQTEGVF